MEIPWHEVSANTIFGSNPFYRWLRTIFAERSHTHTISDVTNLQSSLNSKQNTIPNYTSVQTMQNYGLTVTVFTDGLTACVVITGTLNGDSSIGVNGNITSIGIILSDYAPVNPIQTPTHSGDNSSKFILGDDGNLRLLNGTSSRSASINATFYYPLASRFV